MSRATSRGPVEFASPVPVESTASGPIAEAIGTIRAHLAEPLNRTSLSLVVSMVLTAGLGVGFWAAAARLYSPADIGRSSALIAALTAIASLCQLNLTNVIVRFLPQIHKRIGLRVFQGYAAAALASLAVASAFVFLAPLATRQFSFLRHDTWLAIGFVLATTAWTVFSLQDSVLTALRKATWVPVENGIFSAAKLALLPVMLALVGVFGVFAAWVAPMFVAIVVVNVLIARKVVPAAAAAQKEASGVVDVLGWRRLIAFLAQDFLGAAIGQVVMTALPLLVLSLLGTEANAYFYVPFTLIITFDLMFGAVATSLTAEAARAPHRVDDFMVMVRRRFMFVQLPLALALVVAAPLVLAVFGPPYVEHSTTVLRLLALASCFRGVAALFAATARLRGSGTQLLAMQLASLLLLIPLTLVLVHHERVDGVAVAWLATSVVVAAGVAPSLWRFTRDPRLADREATVTHAGREL